MVRQVPEIVIFDLDGTILNTITDLGNACNHALLQVGLAPIDIDVYPHLVGNGVNKLIERAIRYVAPDSGMTVEAMRHYFIPYYDAHCTDCTKPYEGVPEMLTELKKRGYQLAVASNKYQDGVSRIVPHFFPDMFEQVLGEHEGCPRKPEPQIIDEIRQGRSALMVGDSLVDIATAKNAAVPVIACSWGFERRDQLVAAEPDYIVAEPAQILSLLG